MACSAYFDSFLSENICWARDGLSIWGGGPGGGGGGGGVGGGVGGGGGGGGGKGGRGGVIRPIGDRPFWSGSSRKLSAPFASRSFRLPADTLSQA